MRGSAGFYSVRQRVGGCASRRLHLSRERLKPPQQQRKAPQTARGFNCTRVADYERKQRRDNPWPGQR